MTQKPWATQCKYNFIAMGIDSPISAKKINLGEVLYETISQIANKLNNCPRKSLHWKTPLQVFIANFETSKVSHL